MGITDEADTDLETDRLLGQQRTDDQGFFDDKVSNICYELELCVLQKGRVELKGIPLDTNINNFQYYWAKFRISKNIQLSRRFQNVISR